MLLGRAVCIYIIVPVYMMWPLLLGLNLSIHKKEYVQDCD